MWLSDGQPMRTKHVAVQVSLPTGELVQVLLSVGRSRKSGALYETQAEFIRDESKMYSFVTGYRSGSVGNGD